MNQRASKSFICFALIVFLCGENLYSQTSTALPYDSNYINKYPSKYSIRIYTAEKQNHLYFFHQSWKDRITFSPVQKFAVGLGFAYKGFAIDLGTAVYHNSILPNEKTKGFNFFSSLYRGRQALDFTFQINKGFTETMDSAGQKINLRRNDINELNFGVNYNFMFNYRKFSFNAAMSGTQIQKKSAGSPFLGFFVADMNIIADSSIISTQFSSKFNPADVGTQLNVFSMGLTGGYAYTLVLPHSFYITASLIPGIAFTIQQRVSDSVSLTKVLSAVAPKVISRNGIGYGGKKFYALALYAIDLNGAALKNKNYLFYTPEKIKLVFGYRLK